MDIFKNNYSEEFRGYNNDLWIERIMRRLIEKWEIFRERRRKLKGKPYRIIHGILFYTRKQYEQYISDIIKKELREIKRMEK